MLKILELKAVLSTMLVLTLLMTPLAVQAQGKTPPAPLLMPENAEIIPDQYIVVYKDDVPVANTIDSVQAEVATQGGAVGFVYGGALNGYSARLTPKALKAVRANPNVAYVEADAMITLDLPEEELNTDAIQLSATWGLDRIDQADLPLSTTYTYLYSGSGVHVYILDTGIRENHNEFGGRASRDYDAIGGNGNDCNGHGTHVAGTIGGATYGVAKKARLHAVRVLDCGGSGWYSQVIAGVNWVANHHLDRAVVNMSLGGSASSALNTALKNMIGKGVVLVVAAGNSNADACNYSPASVPGAITVGSTSSNDTRSSFSNWGSCLDIFAPGSGITSAWHTSNAATNTISGTSMASPHVAGVVALYLQAHPTASVAAVRNAIVSNSTVGRVTNPAGSANRLLYSLFHPISDAVSPAGTTMDRTPTFKWSKVAGATQYRFEVMKGAVLLYTKTVNAGAVCKPACANTPTTSLSYVTHKWRVQAFVDGIWQAFSAYKTFKVIH